MKAILLGSRALTLETRHFDFEVPETDRLIFEPGQFVSLSHNFGEKEITRAYSISSAPDGNRFSLCLNRVPDGHFSPYLFDLAPGGCVDMKGPLGTFTLRPTGRPIVMVATGTGIAPFRSMLEHRARVGIDIPCSLVFGVRYEENLLYGEELYTWARNDPHFHFHPVISRFTESWTGWRGHVQQHVVDLLGEDRNLDIYICGLKLMVDDLRARLKAMGFDRRQIIHEKYD